MLAVKSIIMNQAIVQIQLGLNQYSNIMYRGKYRANKINFTISGIVQWYYITMAVNFPTSYK